MRFASFDEMLAHYAGTCPDRPALLFERNGIKEEINFAALRQAVALRADALRATGKTSEGVICDGSLDCVIEILAAVKAGLQLTLLGANATPRQIELTDADLLWGDEEITQALRPALTNGVTDGAGRVLFFTSGTTDSNKAVALTERSLCASAYNGGALLPLSREDILLCMLPLDHVFGFVCGLLWGLSCGACVALGRGPRHYFDDCAFFRPTALSAVPLLLGFLIQKKLLSPTLRLVLIGAGDCPETLPAALKAMGVRVSFGYGLTETSSGVALSLGDDPYAMTVCPDDEVTLAPDGEILIRCDTCMMQGYYKNEAATRAALRDGVLYTGDLGAFDGNGLLHITGRKKEILVLRDGTKVFLPEYERALLAALPGRDFAAAAEDGFPVLIVYGKNEEKDALLRQIEPVMQGLPLGRRVKKLYIVNEPLPRTATGKIKRWMLQQKAVQT